MAATPEHSAAGHGRSRPALHQCSLEEAWRKADIAVGDPWLRVGVTVMIGQNDVPNEVFSIPEAAALNVYARKHGVGLLSMWSMNRDATCRPPLPVKSVIVRDSCSGIDQQGQSFADVLAGNTKPPAQSTSTAVPTDSPSPTPTSSDDPLTSPYPIWDPLSTYPKGSKVVYEGMVYIAKWYTSGFPPDTPVAAEYETPWRMVGPVLPGDKPAPAPTVPPGTYPKWNPEKAYFKGARVQVGLVAYEARFWSQGVPPGTSSPTGERPWAVVIPASE